ncbi:MAG: hypothetical protein AVDCRST_MAG56-1574 [uncultured Cytophagales bacterium]|uniref:Uncharacterized protein n=1 Tax=uncultured Cytophagales bacterium TaxID=158755 RepID=A0A6J4I125_9SPHI|nr:MAG: hypothetical protein AVDCRST_MAG56-1574 [uncultured Cytophagales bacterium]
MRLFAGWFVEAARPRRSCKPSFFARRGKYKYDREGCRGPGGCRVAAFTKPG